MAVGWKIIRQIPIFPPHSAPSALQASLKPKDLPRSPIGIVLAAGPLQQRRNGWDKTADMRSISWLFRTSGFASELEAGGPAMLPHRDCARPEGLRIPVALAAGPLQQGGTAGTKRLICGAYHGFSTPPALQASLKPKAQKKAAFRRNAGIRTRDTILSYTRFPGVPLKPLEHLS